MSNECKAMRKKANTYHLPQGEGRHVLSGGEGVRVGFK